VSDEDLKSAISEFMKVPKRKSHTKKDRSRILEKTDGKCGYCGILLEKRWHVDHLTAFVRGGKCEDDNFMASCPQCNLYKGPFSIEQFRRLLKTQVDKAREYSVNFRFAEKYGQIEIKDEPIVFYFEKEKNSVGKCDE